MGVMASMNTMSQNATKQYISYAPNDSACVHRTTTIINIQVSDRFAPADDYKYRVISRYEYILVIGPSISS